MLYAFLGSALIGALSAAILLWRKAVVEKERDLLKVLLKGAQETNAETIKALLSNQDIYAGELASRDSQITTLRKQRDEAIDKLVKSGSPGSVGSVLRDRHKDTDLEDPNAE